MMERPIDILNWCHPDTQAKIEAEVTLIKAKLRELEWTAYDPTEHENIFNHGPLGTREQAAKLYSRWQALVNPYNL